MKKYIDKILISIKKIKFSKQMLKENYLFLLTLIALIVNDLLLRVLTIGNFFEFQPFFGTLGVSLLLCTLGILVKEKRKKIYYGSLIVLSIIITLCNSMYYNFYSSFVSVSLISSLFQLGDVKDAVSDTAFKFKELLYFWPLVVFIIMIEKNKLMKIKINKKVEKIKFFLMGTISIVLLSIFILTLNGTEKSLVQQWSREYIVNKFGIYIYQVNDIIRSIEPNINTLFGCDQSLQNVRDYYENNVKEKQNNAYTNIFEGKNIIMIHAESMQQFLIDLKFNDLEVTPTLNKLSKEGIYFSNFYTQVGAGTSSDTEFTLATSLLPVKSGTAFVTYWDREYLGIPKILSNKGYYTYSMHGNIGSFWNRIVMHDKLGYNKFYSKTSYQIDETIGLGLSDKSFFRQSIPIMKEIQSNNKNFYATLIMLSNHTPFSDLDKYGEFDLSMKIDKENEEGIIENVTVPYMENTKLGRYIKSSHYADSAISEFINGLDSEGLLENTVLVIYGDHDARISKKDYEKLYNYDPYNDNIIDKEDPNYKEFDYYSYELNRKVPLIIWTKDKKYNKEVTNVMGMVDVLPTLGNMFNFSSEYALGNDIFSVKDNIVVLSNGNWLTDKIYYNSQKKEYLPLSNEVISLDYIQLNIEKAEKLLSVSDDFVVCDFIADKKNSKVE